MTKSKRRRRGGASVKGLGLVDLLLLRDEKERYELYKSPVPTPHKTPSIALVIMSSYNVYILRRFPFSSQAINYGNKGWLPVIALPIKNISDRFCSL